MMMIPAWTKSQHTSIFTSASALTCIMNIMMGLLGLYIEGFPPSKMPPWGGALTVLAAVAPVVVKAVVTRSVTVVVTVAIPADGAVVTRAYLVQFSQRRNSLFH